MDEVKLDVTPILGQFEAARRTVFEQAMAGQSPTLQNVARQTVDAIDTAALFLNQFAWFVNNQEQMVNQAAETAMSEGNVVNFEKK